MYDLTLGSRLRCLLVWVLATAAALLTVAWAAPDLRDATASLHADDGLTGEPFDRLVVWLAAAALAGCAAWAWVVTGIVVVQALVGRPRDSAPGVPRWLRATVLLACGLAVAGAGTAHAQDGRNDGVREQNREVLAGLPPPERVLGEVRPAPSRTAEPAPVHVVRPGDTLWDIAAADLGGRPDPARTAAHWHRIYRQNRTVIGADPDLIQPGQQLRMPTPPIEER